MRQQMIQMREETQSHSPEVCVPAKFVVAPVVVLVVIFSTPLVLLPIPVDLE